MPATESLPPLDGTGPVGPDDALLSGLDAAPSVAILHVLRVTLHVGFAALLGRGCPEAAGIRWRRTPCCYVWAGTAVVLAGVYLTGTILEKRFAAGGTGFDPRRYGVLWLGIVTALWARPARRERRLRLAGVSALLPAPAPAAATDCAADHRADDGRGDCRPVGCQRAARPPSCGRSGSPVRCGVLRRDRAGLPRALPARRRTSAVQPMNSGGPVRSWQHPSTTPVSWPSASGWPGKSTTPSPKGCPASSWWRARRKNRSPTAIPPPLPHASRWCSRRRRRTWQRPGTLSADSSSPAAAGILAGRRACAGSARVPKPAPLPRWPGVAVPARTRRRPR